MGDFSEAFKGCMSSHGLPTPGQVVDGAAEVLEFLHQLHTACAAAGADEEMTIGALIAAGAAVGIDEAVLDVLGDAAAITVGAYIAACAACVASAVTPDILQGLLASAEPDVQNQFAQLGGAQAATA